MSFITGVVGTVLSTLIIYFFRYRIGGLINFLAFNIYPDVTGTYRAYSFGFTDRRIDEAENGDIEENRSILSSDASNRELLKWLKDSKEEAGVGYHVKFEFRQFANRVSGYVKIVEDGNVDIKESIKERITPSRILILNSETQDEDHHNLGTYFLNLTNDQTIIKGTHSALCINCGDATSEYLLLEKEE